MSLTTYSFYYSCIGNLYTQKLTSSCIGQVLSELTRPNEEPTSLFAVTPETETRIRYRAH